MFYLFKQSDTELDVNKSWMDFEKRKDGRCSVRKLGVFLYAVGFLGLSAGWQLVNAQTFDRASAAELESICSNRGTNVRPFPQEGSQLLSLCNDDIGGATPASAGVGSQSQPNSILISQQQLKDAQTNKEKEDMVPGGSADVVTGRWGKFSTFLTAGATTLRHHSNEFEDGYSATIPSVTIGGGYLVSDNLEAGLAFNYSNSDGDYNTGGGFEVDSYTPLFYINYLPFDNAFTNLVLGYTRQDQSNNRIAVVDITGDGTDIRPFSTKSEFSTNQYNLNFLGGYDFLVENFTFGPRVGVNARYWDMEAYQEFTNTGLELSYNSQHQTSIQTKLGLSASFAHRLASNMTIVPRLTASWVHEFSNNSRTIRSEFVQATGSSFSFETERPARNWAVIDLGVSLIMQREIQVFANFSTVQGNRNFESYGGNLGVRVGF